MEIKLNDFNYHLRAARTNRLTLYPSKANLKAAGRMLTGDNWELVVGVRHYGKGMTTGTPRDEMEDDSRQGGRRESY